MKPYATHGRSVPYAIQLSNTERNKLAANYLRQNTHRLQLGNLGFDLTKKDGTKATIEDLKDIHQRQIPNRPPLSIGRVWDASRNAFA